MHDARDREHHSEFGDALELVDTRSRERVAANHWRVRMELFEILNDREGFREMGAVRELEHRELAQGIAREVLGCVLFSLAKAHDHLLQADARASSALFGEVEAHARGMRRDREDVEPHHCLDRAWIRQAGPYGATGSKERISPTRSHQETIYGRCRFLGSLRARASTTQNQR